jgi:hypothetical protein
MIARIGIRGLAVAIALTMGLSLGAGNGRAADASTADTGWTTYGNDAGDTHYSPLAQIKPEEPGPKPFSISFNSPAPGAPTMAPTRPAL